MHIDKINAMSSFLYSNSFPKHIFIKQIIRTAISHFRPKLETGQFLASLLILCIFFYGDESGKAGISYYTVNLDYNGTEVIVTLVGITEM